MIDHIIEIGDTAARLSLQNNLMHISLPTGQALDIPVSDVQCLILSTPALSITGALLARLAEEGATVVVSDEKHMPVSLQLPLVANCIQAERFQIQNSVSLPLRKQLWKTIVRAKIVSQARNLKEIYHQDYKLDFLAKSVKSGDPDNMEAQAARIYWQHLFAGPFLRDREAMDNNLLLNYGYSILRAMAARACCGAGLHPTMGINHKCRYDAFCLADDLMEPYRYVIDRIVYELNPLNLEMPLSTDVRRKILSRVLEKIPTPDGNMSLAFLLQRSAEMVTKSYMTGKALLVFPDFFIE